MSNCNKLILDYSKAITPTLEQMQKMKTSRQALEKKIIAKFYIELGITVKFFTQGSGAKNMRTIIIKENGTYDADRGVYLPEIPNLSAETIQRYLLEAVSEHTADGAEHRRNCIRVYYKYAYNIDFPVYYQVKGEDYSYMAFKGNGWVKDDPWHMITWLEKKKDKDSQLIRMIKYLKGWASKCTGRMPSGIALAVWAAHNFSPDQDRDDRCLATLLKAIEDTIALSVSCLSPVEPFDDFCAKLSDGQRTEFRNKLTAFSTDAHKALYESNQLTASKLWRKHLGERFPLGEDVDVDKRADALFNNATTILTSTAKLGSTGIINAVSGVNHQPHRNYGS
jgi:hypothetical protein